MRLKRNGNQHRQQGDPIGNQLQKPDAVQKFSHPPRQGPAVPLLRLFQLIPPFGQARGKKQNNTDLSHLGRLKAHPDLDPAPGATAAAAQRRKHQQQQDDRYT